MNTTARLLTGHGKSSKVNVCGTFFLKKNVARQKANSTVDFKTISFVMYVR